MELMHLLIIMTAGEMIIAEDASPYVHLGFEDRLRVDSRV